MSRGRDKLAQILLASQTSQLTDTIVASVLAASLTEGICQFRNLDGSLGLTLFAALLLCSMTALLSQRWWLAPVLIGTPAMISALIIWRLDVWPTIWESLSVFAEWCQNWLRFGLPEAPQDLWPTWLRLILLLPLAVFFQFLVRRLPIIPIYAGLLAIFFIPLLIWYPDSLSAFLLALGGLIILLPRQFVRIVHQEKPAEPELPRAPMQLLAIPAAILCLFFAQIIIPDSTMNWRLPTLVNQINDWQDLWQNRFGGYRSWHAFSIAEVGFQPDGSRLGGPVDLDDRVILTVRAEQPLLLKGISRSIYTGKSWLHQSGPLYRFSSNLWWSLRQQAFDTNLPTGAAGRDFLANFRQTETLQIDSTYPLSTLFAAGKVREIRYAGQLDNPPYFTNSGDLFVYESLSSNSGYAIITDYLDQKQDGFDAAFLVMEEALARTTDRNWPVIRQNYLQLPDNLPAIVTATARAAVDPESSPYQQALDLVRYFQTGYTYTLRPDMPPADVDFVAHFLETREGYCVYFATTMAVMARTLGIPARYAEGFILQPADASGNNRLIWEATANSAHAWVELYFANIGWVTFDPTPGNPIVQPGDIPEPEQPTPTPEPEQIPPTPTPAPGPDDPDNQTRSLRWLWLLILPLLLLLASRLALAVLRQRHAAVFEPEMVRKRLPDPVARLEFYYRDLLRQLECLNIRPESGETLVNFAARADRYLRLGHLNLPDVLWPVNRWRYGDLPPVEAELLLFAELHRRVEDRLRESLSRIAYLLRRIL